MRKTSGLVLLLFIGSSLLPWQGIARAPRCGQVFVSLAPEWHQMQEGFAQAGTSPSLQAYMRGGDWPRLWRELTTQGDIGRAEIVERALMGELQNGPLKGLPRYLPKGSTEVYLVELRSGLQAIFKPDPLHWVVDSKRENWLYSNSNGEVATYQLSRLLSLNLVPPTVIRIIDGKRGSLQLFVRGDGVGDNQQILTQTPLRQQSQDLLVLDYLVRNADRNLFNLLHAEGVLWGIDHGSTFHPNHMRVRAPRLTELSRERMSSSLWQKLLEVSPEQIRQQLGEQLDPVILQELLHRREDLIDYLAD